VLQTELDGLTPQVAYHRSLETEQKSFAAREETLAAITANRINWTKKLDELITVINSGGAGQRHYVWLDDLTVTQSSDPRSKSAGSVRAAGHSGSEKFDQIANFLEDLEKSPFIEDFEPPAPPEGSQSNEDKELIPSVVWSFPLQLNLKSPEDRVRNRAPSGKAGGPASMPQPGAEKAPAQAAGPEEPATGSAGETPPAASGGPNEGQATGGAAKTSKEAQR